MDIQCVFVDQTTRRVSIKLGSKIVTGATKLLQIVVLSLLNVPGKDILDSDVGGGLPALIGANFDPTDKTELFAEVARRVKKSQTEIIQSQIGSSAPASEKLREIQIMSITAGATIDSADVTLKIVGEDGRIQSLVL